MLGLLGVRDEMLHVQYLAKRLAQCLVQVVMIVTLTLRRNKDWVILWSVVASVPAAICLLFLGNSQLT